MEVDEETASAVAEVEVAEVAEAEGTTAEASPAT
jgi:hypothetical protein